MSSLEYWKDREETARQHYLTEEADIQKELQKKYTYLQSEIEKEINGFYQKYASSTGITMADAMQAVSKMDVQAFQEKAKKYVKTRDFSDRANAELKLYNATMKINRLELLKANIGLEMIDTFNDQEKLLDDAFYNRAIDEFERQAGILGMGVSDAPKSARQIVNASFQNAKFSDRIWLYQGQLKNELSSLLLNGIVQGTHSRVLARHIEKVFGATRSNSERLMRTEMARIQTAVQEESFKKNGFDQYVFLALGTACDICRAINGQHFDVSKMQPGENAPPMHPNCRCSTAAWMDAEEAGQWRKNNVWADGEKESIIKPENPKRYPNKISEALEAAGIKYNQVTRHKEPLNESEIIESLGGGDRTIGSCASVGLAYCGQKHGLNVLDFRGGESQHQFSLKKTLSEIAKLDGLKAFHEEAGSSLTAGARLLKQAEKGKEYYLVCGRHAAIVRRTESDTLQYLELQSAVENGWKNFNGNPRYTLNERFGETKSHKTIFGTIKDDSFMIDVDSFAGCKEFQDVLGYLNTAKSEQQKGIEGHEK